MATGAGISFVPSPVEDDSLLGSYTTAAGVCTTVRYEVDYDNSVTPPTSVFRFFNPATNALIAPTAAEALTFSGQACGKAAMSATIRIAAGTGVTNAQTNPDGAAFNINAYLTSAGVVASLGGVAVLQAYEFLVQAADSNGGASFANRVDLVEPGNNNGAGAARAYFLGESASADASDSQIESLRTAPNMTWTCVGNSRAVIKITVKRA